MIAGSYTFGKYNYFDKKSNLIPTIFTIILISNTNSLNTKVAII